jgi:P-type Mg2+ transporter
MGRAKETASATEPVDAGPGFWRQDGAALLRTLSASPEGLTAAAAAERRRKAGPNILNPRRERALVLQFLGRFKNPLVLLLLAASAVSAATGDVASFIIITVVVVLSVALDFVQEHRAGQAAERLRRSVAVRATALRDGAATEVAVADLVPGDVVLLAAGSLVPADGLVLAARDFFVNQALLTGEPYPVEKRAGGVVGGGAHLPVRTERAGVPPPAAVARAAADDALAEAGNAVFMGSSVVAGTARVLLGRTGARTALGEIGESLSGRAPATAFELGTRSFGLLILRLAMLMVLFVILVNTFRHRPLLESFLFAVALAVGLTPELLPMIVSVTLARGALRMAAAQVIVKRLAAILDLGAMTVLCTDKTGTLTEARIRLEKHLDPEGRTSQRVLELAYLNSAFETGLKSPLDEAILRHEEIDVSAWEKVDEVPFDFERRRVSVLAARGGEPAVLVVKGALEDVLRLSTRYEGEGPADLKPLDEATRAEFARRFDGLCNEGYRVLGIAWKEMAAGCRHVAVGDEAELTFAGFAAFEDPPKASAAAALAALARAGVAVKVVTGDNELVTQHVCRELGLPLSGVLTGAEIQHLDDPALRARAAEVDLFCRVTPALKNRVILALKHRGQVVGYLGDGINDAPSLHSADVGISVDGGVDVAKAAADLILLRPDLAVLEAGVREGRRTFGNIMKYVLMATSSNFGNMFSMAGAALVLPFLPMLPVQVLLNNFLYDLSEIPIPMDTVDPDAVLRPRRWDMDAIRRFMLVVGPVSSIFDFLTFFVLLRLFHAGEALFHTGWFVESLATQVLVIFVLRTRGSPFASRPSRLLTLTSLAVVAVAILLPWTPLGGRLGFVPPPAAFFLVLALMVVLYLAIVQATKTWFYARFQPV